MDKTYIATAGVAPDVARQTKRIGEKLSQRWRSTISGEKDFCLVCCSRSETPAVNRHSKTPAKVEKYCDALEALNSVVVACFGKELEPDFEEKIGKFKQSYLELDINVTSKAHILFAHTPEFITGRSLSIYAEQAGESSHADFDACWCKYKIRDVSHPNVPKKLLQCVNDYNGNHT